MEDDPSNLGEYINCYKDPKRYYLDYINLIYKKCYNSCEICNIKGDKINHNCLQCNSNYSFVIMNNNSMNCYENCSYYYYFDNESNYYCTVNLSCPQNYKLISEMNKCINNCDNDDKYKYEYNNNCLKECPINTKIYLEEKKCLDSCYNNQFEYRNICYNYCPNNTYKLYQNRRICSLYIPENYYLDATDDIYRECYNTCKKCNQSGNEIINNCDECIYDYIFINESSILSKNCYKKCNYYYYFNETKNYTCTESNKCPEKFNILINQKNKCVDECKNDDKYTYNYGGVCVEKCPTNTKIDDIKKQCLELCNENQIELNNKCYDDISNITTQLFQNGNIFINNLTNFDNVLYDIILSGYLPEGNNNLIIQRSDDVIFHVTNSKAELELLKSKEGNNNISIIDLGECEAILRKNYHINENDSLIFIKKEKISSKASEKNINYDIYEPYNKTKLNLSLCDGTAVNIYIPMELNEENKKIYEKMKELGYDMFNINDPFYQDICTTFDSSSGTDMLLTDRINYIYNNDDTQRQPNCQFSFYSIESKYLNCSCSTNENMVNDNNNKVDKFTAKKIYEMFYDVLKYSNYDIIKCFSIILDKNIFVINIGNIIVMIYFFCYIVCLFIYICKDITPLKAQLKSDINKNQSEKFSHNNKGVEPNLINLLNPPIKKNATIKLILKNNELDKKKIKNKIKINNKKKGSFSYSSRKYILNNSKFIKLDDIEAKKENNVNNVNKKQTEKNKQKLYDDYELNELEYIEATIFDKRSLFQIYWATLKREHLLIFTFFNCNDYNLLSTKLARFIILFVGDMALNVFFFSDDSMHKLFLNYGKYDIFQQIPQITYSTIISQLIEVFLCFLSLTDKYMYQFKSYLLSGEIIKIKEIIRCIRLKINIFFLFTFIIFYIITVFCGVYRNTQITFIKDSLVSFSISLAYPFVIYFLTSIFRICSLRSPKKNMKCLYKLSYIIPFF